MVTEPISFLDMFIGTDEFIAKSGATLQCMHSKSLYVEHHTR